MNNKKAFTIIELVVVVAIIGILVLFGMPKLIGYVGKAQLTRIMHDTKIMEAMMEDELVRNLNVNYQKFIDNGKDLGLLIETNRLFETEGYAKNLQYVPMKGEIDGLSKHFSAQINDEGDHEKLGMGGPIIQEEDEFKEMYERYKIIPEEYKVKAGSKLKGTFYSNENGKVYYEVDKPLGIKSESKGLNCSTPLPDYTFEHEVGKIVKYNGSAEHLVIPPHFLVDGECWPVRIIGKGAFMQGDYKSILIPDTVIIIEDDAFKDLDLDEIYIPGSVDKVGKGAFDGNYDVIYGGSPGRINQGSGGVSSYTKPDGGIGSITYRPPTPGEAGVVFNPETGTIVKGGGSSSIGGGYIPPYITVGNKEYPVKKIAKGAYQGQGLITVILPETLEVIEDYAFSGNQLIGIRIPFSVYHIGHYAFSFNEVWKVSNISGPERKATMKSMLIKDEEQFSKIDKLGNIMENDVKTDYLKGSEEKGPDVKLLDHIWVTSIGNVVIDVEYTPDKCWLNQKGDIIFCGLSPEAFDGDEKTSHQGTGVITWEGPLEGRAVRIILTSSGYTGPEITIQDEDNINLNFINLNNNTENVRIRGDGILDIIVPKNAKKITISGYTHIISEVQVISPTDIPNPVSSITSIETNSNITLNWEQNESDYLGAAIYRNGNLVSIVAGTSFIDGPLAAGEKYIYEIYAMNKNKNINISKVTHEAHTTKSEILLKGLSPAAFDGDEKTSHQGTGVITWEGPLEGRAVRIILTSSGYTGPEITIQDENDRNLNFINLNNNTENVRIRGDGIFDIIVPKNAKKIIIGGYPRLINEVQVISPIDIPSPVSSITSIETNSNITLNWEQNESDYLGAAVYRNGNLASIITGKSFIDGPLAAGEKYIYEIYAMNKNKNINISKITHEAHTTKSEILLKGLSPAAFDGDEKTSHQGTGVITWEGPLEGKAVRIILTSSGYTGPEIIIQDENNKNLIFINLNNNTENVRIRGDGVLDIIVPKNAKKIIIGGYTRLINEVQVISPIDIPSPVSSITSIETNSNIILNWEQNESDYLGAAIYRNGNLASIITGKSFIDGPLAAGEKYIYEIYAMNKNKNINISKITHEAHTTRPPVLLKGLSPAAFDGDEKTSHQGAGIITWEGLLEGKAIRIILTSSGYTGPEIIIQDENNKNLNFINLNNNTENVRIRGDGVLDIIVPKNAKKIIIGGYTRLISEVQIINPIDIPSPISNLTKQSENNNIALTWKQSELDYQKALIYRNGTLHKIITGHSLQETIVSDIQYTYEIYAMNKDGNISDNSVSIDVQIN